MREQLEKLLEDNQDNIKWEVIKEALDSWYEDDYKSFFNDLLSHGCQSGMIWALIYYSDTHKFYDKHYNEIEDIRSELQDEWILSSIPDSDLKNYFAWLSFEHRAYEISNELEMEL